jgi:hypothetical protein
MIPGFSSCIPHVIVQCDVNLISLFTKCLPIPISSEFSLAKLGATGSCSDGLLYCNFTGIENRSELRSLNRKAEWKSVYLEITSILNQLRAFWIFYVYAVN